MTDLLQIQKPLESVWAKIFSNYTVCPTNTYQYHIVSPTDANHSNIG